MISLLLLFLTLVISGIFQRIGAIALELTGLPRDQAEFQALSAFSGVGFTTKEAEYALSHPQRRKIIKSLIRFGSAGIITTMVAFVGTMLSSGNIYATFTRNPNHSWMPFNMSAVILIAAIVFFFLIYKALRRPAIARLVTELISGLLLKTQIVKPVSFQEILVDGNGSGVFQIEVTENNPLLGKTIRETDLEESEIKTLYVNRLSESIDSPPPSFRFQLHDIVTVFGPAVSVYDHCVDLQAQEKSKSEIGKGKLEKDAHLALGTQAPEFSLPDQNGRQVSLSDFKGRKNLVIVFYPKDKSFFCTTQLKVLSNHLQDVQNLNAEIVAINQDSVTSHSGFCDASNLRFSLLSDPSKQVCKAYQAAMMGGLLVDRTVYILDSKGIIRYAQRGKPAVTEILSALRQISESQTARPE